MRRPGPPLHGDMQTPRREVNSTNEDSDAVASAGDAVATIAPLAPVKRGGPVGPAWRTPGEGA